VELATLETLRAERTALEAAWDRHAESEGPDEEDFETTEARLSAAEAELDAKEEAAQNALTVWTPEQMARSGALLRIDYRGNLIVDRGLVRAEDAKARRAEGEGGNASEDDAGDGAPGSDGGGDAAGDRKRKRSDFSEKLMRDLTAHRTAALQAALMQNPHVALVVLVHRLAQSVFSHHDYRRDVVRITLQQTSDTGLAQDATDYENSPAGTLLGRAATEWGERVPGSSDTMFAWLLKQDQETLLELLAYCTARSLDAIASKQRSHDHSDDIAQEAVKEATGSDPAKELDGKRKPDAVAWCVGKMEGTRWLPAPLRILAVRAARLGVDYAHAPADDSDQNDNIQDIND
jgi:ParB family chromosome partitioning protein